MCDRAERRFTAEEREEEHYQTLYAEVEAADREDYDLAFGPTYRRLYPYEPDGPKIHKIVERMMRSGSNG